MTHVESDLVVHERDRDVAVEILTRLQPQIGEVVGPGDLAVELAEETGDPMEARFHEHDLKTREPFERSGEDPPRHDLGKCHRGERREDRRLRCGIAAEDLPQGVAVAEMVADRQAGLLEHAPERVVARLVVIGQPELAREVRKMHRPRAHTREPLDLGHRVRDVDDRHLIRDGEAIRIVRGEVAQVVAERTADRTPVAADETERPKRADLRVQNLGFDAVSVHGGEPRDRIAIARVAHRLHVEVVERELLAFAQLGVDAGLLGDRIVERLVQCRRHALTDRVEAHGHVRIGGDQPGTRHRSLQTRCGVAARKHTSYYHSVTQVAPPSERPGPIVTEDSAVFWDAAAEHRLVGQRCTRCATLRHPPRPMCPHCGSLEVEVVELSGRGTVYSYALLHHPQHPAFDYPVVAVLVDLDEGIRLVSNLTDIDPADVRIGMRVEVAFVDTADGAALPVFHRAPTEAAVR